LAREFLHLESSYYSDLENAFRFARFEQPMAAHADLHGLVVIGAAAWEAAGRCIPFRNECDSVLAGLMDPLFPRAPIPSQEDYGAFGKAFRGSARADAFDEK